MNSQIVTLSEPLKTHDGDVTTITVNEPRAKSFFDHGEPFKTRVIAVEGQPDQIEFEYNTAILRKFLMDMTGIDDLILGKVTARDFFALRNATTNLIMGVAGQNPTKT